MPLWKKKITKEEQLDEYEHGEGDEREEFI